ncbi:hypothetical protein HPULCUR_009253 [Helicostylum pulchrum]|uniref:Uncharacterized protein n=1 Tax=Helicostylum pulchrum TaxID=562976 RepID=A0ABP9Y9X6_9FUNG
MHIDDLKNADSNGRDLFACFAQTDGHSISLQFVRKRRDKYSETPILALEDFSRTEVEENFLPYTIDPGRKNIYTAAIGHNSKEHQVRRCSDLERRCYTGSRRRQAYESAPFSFYDYQGRQRANAEAANTILNGGKNTILAKEKTLEKIERKEGKRERRKKKEAKLIEDTEKKDEEKYEGAANIKSATPASDTKAAEPAAVDTKVANPAERQKEKGNAKLEEKNRKWKPVKVSGILECEKTCHLLWQRDVNATKNMLDIANSIWEGQGRPNPFNRPIDVEKTVSL